MFTGIIESLGTVIARSNDQGNLSFWIASTLTGDLKVDQSVSHDGVCLTVEAIEGSQYRVTAIEETRAKTNIDDWDQGRIVNLERCMVLNGRLDGHIVQGHVDAVAICDTVQQEAGSHIYRFRFSETFAHLVIEKGSIAVNGTSLTCFDITQNMFSVAIIPYTFEHTSIGQVQVNSKVNIEFDVIGKYIARRQQVLPVT